MQRRTVERDPLPPANRGRVRDGVHLVTIRQHVRRRVRRSKITNSKIVRLYLFPRVTIADGALKKAGLRPGDKLRVTTPGPGMVLLTVIPQPPRVEKPRPWEVAEPLSAEERAERKRRMAEPWVGEGKEEPAERRLCGDEAGEAALGSGETSNEIGEREEGRART